MSRAADRDDIEQWVIFTKSDITEQGAVRSYALFHTVEGEEIERLCTVGKVEEKSVEAILLELWNTAENDADTRVAGLPQRYAIHAYRDDPEEPDAHITFIRTSQAALGGKRGASTEPATEKGVLGQLMRQVEEGHRLLVGYSESVAGRLARENQAMKLEIEGFREKHMQLLERQEELLDKKFERDQKRRDSERRELVEEKAFEILLQFAPLIAQKVVGENVLSNLPALLGALPKLTGPQAAEAQGGSTGDANVAEFLKTLDGADVQKILDGLGPEKATKLLAIYETYSKMH